MMDATGEICWGEIKECLQGQVGTSGPSGVAEEVPRLLWSNALLLPQLGISGTCQQQPALEFLIVLGLILHQISLIGS